jgi:undecaprenyl-diphosphatase
VNFGAEPATTDNRLHPVAVTALVGLVAWIVLAACALALGAVVTHFVVGHSLGHTDLDVSRWFAARRTDTWNALSSVGSYVAETITVFAVVAIALAILTVKRAWPQCGLLVVAMAAEGATYLLATFVVTRNRPAVPRLEDLIVTDSYPSGHTAASVALYGSLCVIVWSMTRTRGWRALFLALAVAAPVVVATARVYRGMHHLTDVLCGALIGAGCIVVGYVAMCAGAAAAAARDDDEAHELVSPPAGRDLEEAVS